VLDLPQLLAYKVTIITINSPAIYSLKLSPGPKPPSYY